MTTHDDGAELVELDGFECFRLLGTQEIGRLAVHDGDHPLIVPVNYWLDRDVVVVRLRAGTTLAAAEKADVSVEVDEIDSRTRTGWSVVVRGRAEELTTADEVAFLERRRASGARPWAPTEDGRWMRIVPHGISGRRLVRGPAPAAGEPGATRPPRVGDWLVEPGPGGERMWRWGRITDVLPGAAGHLLVLWYGDDRESLVRPSPYARTVSPDHVPQWVGDAVGLLPRI